MLKFACLAVVWMMLGNAFLDRTRSRENGRRILRAAGALIALELVAFLIGGVTWRAAAFVLTLTFFCITIWPALSKGTIAREHEALRAGAGLGYLAAGTITGFAVLFGYSRLEYARAPLAVALLLQLAFYNVNWVSEAHFQTAAAAQPGTVA